MLHILKFNLQLFDFNVSYPSSYGSGDQQILNSVINVNWSDDVFDFIVGWCCRVVIIHVV